MSKSGKKNKGGLICSPEEGEVGGERLPGHEKSGDEDSEIPDWRLEMRREIWAALAESFNERPLSFPLGPSEIDATTCLT